MTARRKRTYDGLITERAPFAAVHLIGLVTLARDKHEIERRRARERRADRLRPVVLDDETLCCGIPLLMASMMASGFSRRGLSSVQHHLVGEPRGNLAHEGTLAGIAIAAATKYDPQAAAAMDARGLQCLRERIGRVRKIHERVRARSEWLHPARRRRCARERRGCRCQRHLPAEEYSQHGQNIVPR